MDQFRNIGIIGRLGSAQVLDTIRRLKKFLLARQLHVILEDSIAEVLPGHGLQTSSRKLLGEICDLVIVVGGVGSVRGALVGSLLVGLVDSFGRAYIPLGMSQLLPPQYSDSVSSSLVSASIYILMAIVLLVKPRGLVPAQR